MPDKTLHVVLYGTTYCLMDADGNMERTEDGSVRLFVDEDETNDLQEYPSIEELREVTDD